jgi:serine/threonine protein kinase
MTKISPASSSFSLDKQLAEGEGTTVFESTYKSAPVAIKQASTSSTYFFNPSNSISIAQAKNELSILSSLPPHPNVITIISAFESNDCFSLVFPLFEFDLFTLLKTRLLTRSEQKDIVRQITEGLLHLHENGIVHRDVKIENILISKDRVVLADLGLAHAFDATPPGNRGSVEYVSPECIVTTDTSRIDFRKVYPFLFNIRLIVLH